MKPSNRKRALANAARLRDKNRCCNCDRDATCTHHVVPLGLGGFDVLSNIVSLCARCHALAHGESPGLHEVAEKRRVESYVFRKTDGRLGGRPKSYDEKTMKQVYALRASGQTFSSIARTLGLARATVHRIYVVYMGIANEGADRLEREVEP